MDKKDIDLLIEQITNVIMNKSLADVATSETKDLQELQEAIRYLATCIAEVNGFIGSLCSGQLDANPPGRHNYLAGNLKELHSVLKFLTWQTSQVAKGDYSQRVRFLGEFSDSFNKMTQQLEEREIKLQEKSQALSQSMAFLVSIMDTQRDWIVVMGADDEEVIYLNSAASKHFYDKNSQLTYCDNQCKIFEDMKKRKQATFGSAEEYYCNNKQRVFSVRCYPIEWEGKKAFVHYLTDITVEKQLKENLSSMAYKDPLTDVFNRRYCIECMEQLIQNKEPFAVVLADLNDLKFVNDNYGHNIGDEYICTTVEVMKKHIRDTDILCRIGGDEFVLLLKNCSENLVSEKMDKIFKDIENIEKNYPMSLSYGITYISSGHSIRPEEILKISDSRMYEFKIEHKKNHRPGSRKR